MTPDDVSVVWPDAGQIGKAIFAAASLEGDDAINVIQGVGGVRSRAYAFIALAHEFPTVPRVSLGRKLGNEKVASGARAALRNGGWAWFELSRLNAVRAACGWSNMTLSEAVDAPLIYCGREWTEFLPQSVADACGAAEAKPEPGARDEAEAPEPIETVSFDPDAEASARVTRRKAWLRGEPPAVAEVKVPAPAPPPVLNEAGAAASDLKIQALEPVLNAEIVGSGAADEAVAAEAVNPEADLTPPVQSVPDAIAAPVPKPLTPSPRAAALAQAARQMAASGHRKPGVVTRGLPIGQGAGPSKASALNGLSTNKDKAAAARDRDLADRRRADDGLGIMRAAAITAGASLSYRPDRPAAERGMVVVEIAGTPPPGRSALDRRNAERS